MTEYKVEYRKFEGKNVVEQSTTICMTEQSALDWVNELAGNVGGVPKLPNENKWESENIKIYITKEG